MKSLLQAHGLAAGYHGIAVVQELNLSVDPGQIVVMLGPNGAGKTTTLLALSGTIPLISGEVRFDGNAANSALYKRASRGLGFVTEERSVFMSLTARENLQVARCDQAFALQLFPELEPLLTRRTGLLSGGEQQMLALARTLARRPRLLLIDELSLGLAPLIVQRLLNAVRTAANNGLGVLLVEQHIEQAMRIADFALVMERGRLKLAGNAKDLAGRVSEIEASYLSKSEVH